MGHGTSYQPHFMFLNMFRNILYWEIYHQSNLGVLIQSGFRVIHKTACANLSKSWYHNYSIFQLSHWMEGVGEEEEGELQNTKKKEKKILKTKRAF